ncbi:Proteasome subunit beta [Aphelenchoides bicaudatus]|nr:Proteasome subunit beta [Aphelenchoides bicaudatus]
MEFELDAAGHPQPRQHTLTPMVTGSSVLALVYDGGVALATDRLGSYGRTLKFKNTCRQYRVNENVVIAFSGDFADFQWIQNVVERVEADARTYYKDSRMTAKGLHNYLSSLLYYRRSKMNPVWTTLVVVGMQPEPTYDNLVPFIGVIDQRGVAFETKAIATGLGQYMLTETLQKDSRAREYKLSKDEALDLLRKCLKVMTHRDCGAIGEYDLTTVDAKGTDLMKPEKNLGDWDIAEYSCHF